MIKFFAAIGFIYFISSALAYGIKCIIALREYIKFKKLIAKTDLKEIVDIINELPNEVNSKDSYEQLLTFCSLMLKKFPDNNLGKLRKNLNKYIGKNLNNKLTTLFISCDAYVEAVLALINSRLHDCMDGEFTMTQKNCEDVRSYILNLQKELDTIALFERKFKNK